jgi:hypothetical protein
MMMMTIIMEEVEIEDRRERRRVLEGDLLVACLPDKGVVEGAFLCRALVD